MKKLLQLEEAVLFAGCLLFYPYFALSWWWFLALFLAPDLSMAGYLVSQKTGAVSYNIFHHRAIALLIGFAGFFLGHAPLQFAGFLLFSHATFDRMLGYGLKYFAGFKYTHLGELGLQKSPTFKRDQ